MAEGKEKNTLGDLIITYSGLVLTGVSLFTYLYLFPSSISDINTIAQLGTEITGISWLNLGAPLVYLSMAVLLILVLSSLVTFFYQNDRISMGFSKQKNSRFFGYLMIYILVQLILSEIFAYFVPGFGNQFPFHQPLGVQNFVFSYLTLEESLIYQFIPIMVIVAVVGIVRGKISLKTFTFFEFDRFQMLSIAFFVSFFATLLIAGTPLEYVSDFFSLFVLNIIFLRFGFLKSLLANFAISMTNVTASLISGNATLSLILPVFLFFMGFLGIYSLVQISVTPPREGTLDAPRQTSVERERRSRVPTIEPFIRSRCPSCGNAVYSVLLPSISLKCTKCGLELEKNAMGENNIKIEMRGSARY